MAGLKRFQYVEKDAKQMLTDCIARLKEKYGITTWNDFEEDNVGMMLLEAFAYMNDLLLFYVERQANETYLSTATERQNVINIAKNTGYVPKNATSAQVDILVSIEKVNAYNVTLPAGTLIQTQSGLSFETSEDAVISNGELSTHVTATEGETFTENIGASNGEAWQNFYISRLGVLEIKNVIINDHVWECVESFAGQEATAEIFTAEIDAWRRAEIVFGNGVYGKIPENGEVIKVTYRVGGGISGNVAPNTITNVRDIATNSRGDSVPVSVTNPDWASGGAEPESVSSIKLWAPRYFETQERCVTEQDYDTFANAYDGIAKAKTIRDEDKLKKGEANIIHVYVLTYGNNINTVALANQTLKDNLLEYLNEYKMLTDWIEIHDGKFSAIDFSGTLTLVKGFNADTVLNNVKSELNSLMNIDTRDMGEPLRISDVYAAIDNIEGVSFVELTSPRQTITPDKEELLILGNIDFGVT